MNDDQAEKIKAIRKRIKRKAAPVRCETCGSLKECECDVPSIIMEHKGEEHADIPGGNAPRDCADYEAAVRRARRDERESP